MSSTFTLADSFDGTGHHPTDLTAPLPLGYAEAVRRGLQLRQRGTPWTYKAISEVLAEVHGFHRHPDWWRTELRRRGVKPRPYRTCDLNGKVRA
jgi:hypothetical protein